eukprot:Nk52_evm1s1931 gene=Nk52_evmTU1s1931
MTIEDSKEAVGDVIIPRIEKLHIPVCVDGNSEGHKDTVQTPSRCGDKDTFGKGKGEAVFSWSTITGNGSLPCERVGHSCHWIKRRQEERAKESPIASGVELYDSQLVVIGGANPSACFGDVHTLDLDTLEWVKRDCGGDVFPARYEHWGAVIPNPDRSADDSFILVYGGVGNGQSSGEKEGSLTHSAYVLDTQRWEWKRIPVLGQIPQQRTLGSCGMVDKNVNGRGGREACVYIWGGGAEGSTAVSDKDVYCMDLGPLARVLYGVSSSSSPSSSSSAASSHNAKKHKGKAKRNPPRVNNGSENEQFSGVEWVRLKAKGKTPALRMGHTLCVVPAGRGEGAKMIVYGGMCDGTGCKDVHVFDIDCMKWRSPAVTEAGGDGDSASPPLVLQRSGHSAVVVPSPMEDNHPGYMIAFGGMTSLSGDKGNGTEEEETGGGDISNQVSVLSDIVCLDLSCMRWMRGRDQDECAGPAKRLSHSLCVVERGSVGHQQEEGDDGDAKSSNKFGDYEVVVFGGMDVEGNFYNDTSVLSIPI